MAHWNHRLVKIKNPPVGNYGYDEFYPEFYYGISEVFYDEDKKPFSFADPDVYENTVEELKETLQCMLRALEQPMLDKNSLDGKGFLDEFDQTEGIPWS